MRDNIVGTVLVLSLIIWIPLVCIFQSIVSRWRKQIGMIDDHDECEWVNASSGTGSPGLSWTKSAEP